MKIISAPFCNSAIVYLLNFIYDLRFTIYDLLRTSYFIKFIILSFFVFSAAIPAYVDTEPAVREEVRGLWVVRDSITSPGKIEEVVDFAETYGYNILFVQVRGRGDAYYRSYFVPGPDDFSHIPDSFDPLATIIELAHSRGIEVHAWVNMYLAWSSEMPPADQKHLVNAHPGWFMVSVDGLRLSDSPIDSVRNKYVEGRYISPAYDEVRSYLSRVITEIIVSYDIDGIHMDYVRYPGKKYDFSDRIRRIFKQRNRVDPVDVVLKGEKVDPTLKYLEKWVEYKTEQIDKQVKSIARRITMANKNIRLSAAVKPSADEAYYEFGQNWAGWLNEGLVDFVVTMSYFPETILVENVMKNSLKKVDRRKVVGGIGAYSLQPRETKEQIKLMRNLGLMGYCIFSYSTFAQNPHYAGSIGVLNVPFNNSPYSGSKPGQ